MECNRDDALRAVAVSENMFAKRDIVAAKKFAVKAQTLYPSLDGISQMIATLNVYLSAEAMINGERDWYAILSLSSSADGETIKKQYRKLALLLHPDKNKSVGAEGAFKLISEAWSILSDRIKRKSYDQRRNFGMYLHNASGFCHFANTAISISRAKKHASGIHIDPFAKTAAHGQVPHMDPTAKSASRHEIPSTFWTRCNHCKMQYEFLRVYVNHKLLCANCNELFLATEISKPKDCDIQHTSKGSKSMHKFRRNYHCASGRSFQYFANLDTDKTSKFYWGAFSRTAGAASAAASSSAAAQAANMVYKAYEKVRKEREEKQAASRQDDTARRKYHASKNSTNGTHSGYSGSSIDVNNKHNLSHFPFMDNPSKKKRISGDNAMNNKRHERDVYGAKTGNSDPNSEMNCFGVSSDDCREVNRQFTSMNKGFSLLDVRGMLMQKAKKLVQKNLDNYFEEKERG